MKKKKNPQQTYEEIKQLLKILIGKKICIRSPSGDRFGYLVYWYQNQNKNLFDIIYETSPEKPTDFEVYDFWGEYNTNFRVVYNFTFSDVKKIEGRIIFMKNDFSLGRL